MCNGLTRTFDPRSGRCDIICYIIGEKYATDNDSHPDGGRRAASGSQEEL